MPDEATPQLVWNAQTPRPGDLSWVGVWGEDTGLQWPSSNKHTPPLRCCTNIHHHGTQPTLKGFGPGRKVSHCDIINGPKDLKSKWLFEMAT